jgi:hypothetical protein
MANIGKLARAVRAQEIELADLTAEVARLRELGDALAAAAAAAKPKPAPPVKATKSIK